MTTATHPLKVGAILESRWGYDQTNVDFYEVTRTTPTMAYIVKLESVREYIAGGFMTYTATPGGRKPGAEPKRYKVQSPLWDDDTPWLKLTTYSSAHEWDGSPVNGSSYA